MHIRIFSPSLTHRIADPMPLPKRSSARKVRLHIRNLAAQKNSGSKQFRVKRIPVGL